MRAISWRCLVTISRLRATCCSAMDLWWARELTAMPALIDQGARVTALVNDLSRPSYFDQRGLLDRIVPVIGSVTDLELVCRAVAEHHQHREGVPVVLVRVKGLAPPQGSRLLDPVIESVPSPG